MGLTRVAILVVGWVEFGGLGQFRQFRLVGCTFFAFSEFGILILALSARLLN